MNQYETTPPGAGMCVRRCVVRKYLETTTRLKFGTNASNYLRCEDSDLAFTACDIGLGIGLFSRLKMTHLIPQERLQEDYLLNLCEGTTFSAIILESFRGKMPYTQKSLLSQLIDIYSVLRMNPRNRRFYYARKRGFDAAVYYLMQSDN